MLKRGNARQKNEEKNLSERLLEEMSEEGILNEYQQETDNILGIYKKLIFSEEYRGIEIVPVFCCLKKMTTYYINKQYDLVYERDNRIASIKESGKLNILQIRTDNLNKRELKKSECKELKSEYQARAHFEILELESNAKKDMNEEDKRYQSEWSAIHYDLENVLEISNKVKSPDKVKLYSKANRAEYAAIYEKFKNEEKRIRSELEEKLQKCQSEYENTIRRIKKKASDLKEELVERFHTEEDELDKESKDFICKLVAEEETDIKAAQQNMDTNIQKAQENFQAISDKMREKYEQICLKLVDNPEIQERFSIIAGNKVNFESFTLVKEMPKMIEIGSLTANFIVHPEGDEFGAGETIIKAVERMNKIFSYNKSGIVRFPYMYMPYRSINLFFDINTKEYHEFIRAWILSLLMQYPAGKMNLVMVNPALSHSFVEFDDKLGADDKNIVDTRVWISEAEIKEAIIRLHSKLSERVNRYGKSVDLCYEREAHILLAIADFPQNFSQQTLRDLRTILESGEKYGISVMISCNSDEMDSVKNKPEIAEEIERIKKRMQLISKNEKNQMKIALSCNGEKEFFDYAIDQKDIINQDAVILKTLYEHIGDAPAYVVRFKEIIENYNDEKKWLQGSTCEEISIPIGSSGKDNIKRLTIGRTEEDNINQHVLIEGTTGSGKSTLLHTIIMSALMKYPPEELQMILLDYKEAVEFKVYTEYNLPSIRVVSLKSDREFGAEVFKLVVGEYEERAKIFKKNNVKTITEYRKETNKVMPMLLLIVDEFSILYEKGDNQKDLLSEGLDSNIALLARQGRSFGIHMIFASQVMNLDSKITSQMAIRFALAGSNNILESKSVISLLQKHQAVFNDAVGVKDADRTFQVAFVKPDQEEILSKISELESMDEYTESFMEIPKKIMFTNFEEYRHHPFNEFVVEKRHPIPLVKGEQSVIVLGESYSFIDECNIIIRRRKGENLLIAADVGAAAYPMISNCLLSLIYSAFADKGQEMERVKFISIFDFSKKSIYESQNTSDIRKFAEIFKDYIEYYSREIISFEETVGSIKQKISDIYKLYQLRKNGGELSGNYYLFIIDFDKSGVLKNDSLFYEDDTEMLESPTTMLLNMLKDAGKYGIHIVASIKDYASAQEIYGEKFENYFNHRIAKKLNNGDIFKLLVHENDMELLGEQTGVYWNGHIDEKVKFRVMDSPSIEWLGKFKERIIEESKDGWVKE